MAESRVRFRSWKGTLIVNLPTPEVPKTTPGKMAS